jgi:hypothetical protein
MALPVSWAEKLIKKAYTRRGVPRSYRAAVCCTTARERMHLWEYKQPVESLALDRDTTSAFITDLEKFGAASRYDIGNCHNNESITEAFSASLKANTFSNHQKYSKY